MDWQYIQVAVDLHSIFIFLNRLLVSAPNRSKPGCIVTFTSIRLLLAFAVLVVGMPQKVALALASDQAAQQSSAAASRGYEIFSEVDRRNSDYGDLEVSLRMILRTASGKATERALRIRQLEVEGDGDRVLVVFDTPANIRGTALLSHGHKTTPDDQWLYLPAIKRVKKIASRNKSGPFLGSEFSFEDLRIPELEKFDYRYIRDDQYQGVPVFVVERVSKEEHSGYAQELHWLDQQEYRTVRVEYFNRRGEAVKLLEVSDYTLYEDRFWKPGRMYMQNLRSGRSTELLWQDYAFDAGLRAERDLSVNSLRRAR